MEIKDIQQFTQDIEPVFTGVLGGTSEEQIMGQLLKVQEELGEVIQSVLGHLGKQTNGKNFSDAGLEMADVILEMFVLADRMNIDLDTKLQSKIEIIKKRFELN